jgi:hypothetical protein
MAGPRRHALHWPVGETGIECAGAERGPRTNHGAVHPARGRRVRQVPDVALAGDRPEPIATADPHESVENEPSSEA